MACIILASQIQLSFGGSKSPYSSGYDHGCDDAKIINPYDRYINEPGKGPSFHTDEFMDGYNRGFDVCSNPDYQPQPQQPQLRLPQAPPRLLQPPPETPEAASGLTVIVHGGQGEVCVYSSLLSNAGCKIATGGDLEFRFRPGEVQVGESFTVSYQGRELKYVNGPQNAPEHVYLEASSDSRGGVILINWGEVCRNPIVDFVIEEPCYTLTTPDGYTLTSEGIRVITCIAAGLVLLIYDPSGATLTAARALGPAVNCG